MKECRPLPLSESIPVVCCPDERYAGPFSVLAESILSHAKEGERYHFYLVHSGLSHESMERMEEVTRSQCSFIDVNGAIGSGRLAAISSRRDLYLPVESYFRIFLAELLPAEDAVMYLDCDMVALSHLDLWDYRQLMEGHLIAAVRDRVAFTWDRLNKLIVETLHQDPNRYFNSGVMLMNLRSMRECRFADRCLEAMAAYPSLVCGDQDIFNIVCRNRVFYLPEKYNVLATVLDRNREKLDPDQTVILHYAGPKKPWSHPEWGLAAWYRDVAARLRARNGNRRMALCMSSYKRFEDLQRQVFSMMNQTYDNFHLFVAVKGLSEYVVESVLKPLFQPYIDQGRLTLRWFPNKNQLSNFVDTVRDLDIGAFDLFLKIDDDDFYGRDYLKTVNEFHDGIPPNHSSYFHHGNWTYRKYGGIPTLHWEHPWYGPSLAITAEVMSRIMDCEREPELVPYYLDKYKKQLHGARAVGFNEDTFMFTFLQDEGCSNIASFVRGKGIAHHIIVQKSNASTIRGGLIDSRFKKANVHFSKDPKDFEYVAELHHEKWRDTFYFFAGRGHRLTNGDAASVVAFSDGKLTVKWDDWGTESFVRQPGGLYAHVPALDE